MLRRSRYSSPTQRRRFDQPLSQNVSSLSDPTQALAFQQRHHRQLVFRIRRLSRIAIIASRSELTARKRRWQLRVKQLVVFRQNVTYHRYRIATSCLVVLFAGSTLLSPFLQADNEEPAVLTAATRALVGETRDDAKEHLNYDSNTRMYSFTVPTRSSDGEFQHTGRNADAYSVQLPKEAKQGVTVTDSKTKIAVTLAPNFFTTPAKKTEGNHLVYQSGNKQLVYTLKYNGLKEDIIVPRYQGPSINYSFKLSLPSGVEARLDEEGNIGIYSADPTLFGNISYSSDDDRARIDQAKQNAEKSNLVMTIPYPTVKDANGHEHSDRAKFVLGQKTPKKTEAERAGGLPMDAPKQFTEINQYELEIQAFNLRTLTYPIAIDPTLRVTSSGDFDRINNEGGTTLDTTNNLIRRSRLTGGTVDSWNATTAFTGTATHFIATAAFNNYIYAVGGAGSSTNRYTAVYYATINSNGTISGWTATSSLPVAIAAHAVTINSGYIYSLGGHDGDNPVSTVRYAKINPNGSLGAWGTTTPLCGAMQQHSAFSYRNFIYGVQGSGNSCVAAVGANGTVGAWSSLNEPDMSQYSTRFTHYNGFVYGTGGGLVSNNSEGITTVKYASILNDGTFSTWTTTSSLNTDRGLHFVVALDGYLYARGGCGARGALGDCTDELGSTEYAPINADGSIGTWRLTSGSTALVWTYATVYAGKIYAVGGCEQALANIGTCAAGGNKEVRYASISSVGVINSWANANAISTARSYSATAVFNDFIYVVSGCTGDNASASSCTATTGLIEYGKVDRLTGTIAWQGITTTGLFTGLWGHRAVAYAGRLYITGGCTRNLITNACQLSGDTHDIVLDGTSGDTFGAFNSRSNVITARMVHGFDIYNNYAYVAGGYNGSAGMTSVQYVALASDGTIPAGTWTTGTALPNTRGFIDAVVTSGYLYIAGGSTGLGGGNYNSILIGALNPSTGAISSWTTNAVTFPSNMWDLSLIINQGLFYAMTRSSNDPIPVGMIMPDGSIVNTSGSGTTFSTISAFPGTNHALTDAYVTSYGNIYGIAGCASTTGTNNTQCNGSPNATVHLGRVNNGGDGLGGNWVSSTSMSTARRDFAYGRYGNRVYVAGGCTVDCTGPDALTSVEIGTFNTDGTISWTNGPSLPAPRERTSGTVIGSYFYVVGGASDTTTQNATVYYAFIEADGSLSSNSCGTSLTWCTTSNLPKACGLTATTSYKNFIYTSSGFCVPSNSSRQVYYATQNPDGTLSSWNSATDLPYISFWSGGLQAAATGHLYYMNGCEESNCSTYHSETHVATISSNGSIGSWTKSFSTRVGKRATSTTIYNGFLYVGGGVNSSQAFMTPTTSTGGVEQWRPIGNTACGGFSGAITAYGGRLYYLAGVLANITANTCYISLNTIPRTGSMSKLYDFDVGVRPTKLITRGTKQAGAVVGVSYRSSNGAGATLDNPQTITDTGYGGASNQTLSLGTNRTLSRYLFLSYTIDDSYSAVFPDSGNESTITDFDMYYTPNPDGRLRGGNTFTGGAERGLDAPPQ